MTIHENLTTFLGKKVQDYEPDQGIRDSENVVYRIRVDWDLQEKFSPRKYSSTRPVKLNFWKKLFGKLGSKSVPEKQTTSKAQDQRYNSGFQYLFNNFSEDPKSGQVHELIIGEWGGGCEGADSSDVINEFVKAKSKLINLKALFIGDIICEECEVSWIKHDDISALWKAYPSLEYFRIRGSDGLSLGNLRLSKLKTLIIETGGLPKNVLDQVCHADLPKLEHLELWLGEENYGWSGTVDQLKPLIDGSTFPHLKYLGIRNSKVQDEVADLISKSIIPANLEILDLSMGTLSDKGAAALLNYGRVNQLKLLDLHHHYLSVQMQDKLKKLKCEVNLSDPQDEDNDDGEVYRYIAVSE
jgi:hypothetical protein